MAIWEDQTVLPLATYGGDDPIPSPDIAAHGATGLLAVLYAKTAGTSTLALRMEGKEPFEGTYYLLNAAKTITTASRHIWIFYPGAMPQPDGEAAVTTVATVVQQVVAIPIPSVFRLIVEKGDTSDWVFGVEIRRLP